MITVSPPETSVRKRPTPTTAGNAQAFGDDRRVAAGAADLGDEAQDELRIEIGRFAGRQIVGQHEHRRGDLRQLFAAPCRAGCRSSRFSMSKMSLARSAMYSPSSDWKTFA